MTHSVPTRRSADLQRVDGELEKARQKDLQVVFEIGERDFFGDVQAFHLVEHRAVRAIGVDAVDAPRTDDADRRLALLHRADLHRRGMRATQAFTVHHVERRSEEHTSELQSLLRIWYAVFCLKK